MKKGIQLYNLRDKCVDAPALFGVLEQLAAFGYEGVEFTNSCYCGVAPETLRQKLADLCLEAIGVHLQYQKWFDSLDAEIEYALKVGIPTMVFPHIPGELRTEEHYKALVPKFGEFFKACTRAGLSMAYHNHAFEFTLIDGKFFLDLLLEAHPGLQLELDSFWSFFAKVDTLSYIQKYASRLPLLHVKDFTDLDAKPVPLFCALGKGKMRNREIIAAAGKAGVKWLVFEQDNSAIDTLESARLALETMRAYEAEQKQGE
jgi:sugar phosphate isomerase/epimerase